MKIANSIGTAGLSQSVILWTMNLVIQHSMINPFLCSNKISFLQIKLKSFLCGWCLISKYKFTIYVYLYWNRIKWNLKIQATFFVVVWYYMYNFYHIFCSIYCEHHWCNIFFNSLWVLTKRDVIMKHWVNLGVWLT